VVYGEVVYGEVRCQMRTNLRQLFLYAKNYGGKWNRPDCAPRRRGGYQPFEISVARVAGGVNVKKVTLS